MLFSSPLLESSTCHWKHHHFQLSDLDLSARRTFPPRSTNYHPVQSRMKPYLSLNRWYETWNLYMRVEGIVPPFWIRDEKDPRDYVEALPRCVSRTQIVFFLARLECWSVRSHVEFRGDQAETGSFIACNTGRSRLYSCYKVILSTISSNFAAFATGLRN